MARLSSKLSPKAKKSVLAGSRDVQALVEVAGSADPSEIERELAKAGVTGLHWLSAPRFVSVEIPSSKLTALADLNDVVYIEVGEKMTL
jgi:hypothetical protein